jgi:hypothetical protein
MAEEIGRDEPFTDNPYIAGRPRTRRMTMRWIQRTKAHLSLPLALTRRTFRTFRICTCISPAIKFPYQGICHVLSCLVVSCCIVSCLVLCFFVLSCLLLSCAVLCRRVLPCLALPCLILSCIVSSRLVLSCRALSCLVSCSGVVLPCLVVSCHVVRELIGNDCYKAFFLAKIFVKRSPITLSEGAAAPVIGDNVEGQHTSDSCRSKKKFV